MALNFPASPSDQDTYSGYIYDATKGVWNKLPNTINNLSDVDTTGVVDGNTLIYDELTSEWIPGEAGSSFEISETAPVAPEAGDVWYNSVTGKSYIYYSDYDSTEQWVEIGSTPVGYLDINQLNDVTITTASDGQVLTYDSASGEWINETPSSTLPGLTDVNITDPADGQALVYDSASGDWVNETPASTLPSLTDVTIDGTPADNEILAYDSTSGDWINQTPAEAGLAEASHSHTTSDITDITIDGTPADNEVLAYDTTAGDWINQTASEAGLAEASHTHTTSDLTDVTITSAADGEILTYNSGAWVNQTLGFSQLPSGSILQVVSGTPFSSDFETLSTTWSGTEPGLEVTITPKFSSSKILVVVSGGGLGVNLWAGGTLKVYAKLFRDGTELDAGATAYDIADGSRFPLSISYLDSPASTSALRYNLRVGKTGPGGFQNSAAFTGVNAEANIIAMEVAN